jgi:hypothetical protein
LLLVQLVAFETVTPANLLLIDIQEPHYWSISQVIDELRVPTWAGFGWRAVVAGVLGLSAGVRWPRRGRDIWVEGGVKISVQHDWIKLVPERLVGPCPAASGA